MSENFSSQEAASWWTRGKAAIVDFLIFIAACLIPGVLIVTSFVIAYDDFWQEFDFLVAQSHFWYWEYFWG